jgi:hypothetical protein
MKRWFIMGMVAVLSTVALIAAMTLTTAQFSKVTPADGNILGMGNIELADWSPDPLITCTNMVPGETREFLIYFMPKGTINQDIYIGLKDIAGDPTCDFAHSGYVNVAWDVGDNGSWEYGWYDILDLFANFRLLAANQASGAWIPVRVSISVEKAMPNSFMGQSADFYVLINAVQAGGDVPTGVPDLWTP